jgi:S1-C subfamily serine protease
VNAVDWVLLVLALAYAVAGWTQGLIVGFSSFVGFVGGAVLGLRLGPRLLDGLQTGLGTAVLALIIVLVLATVGQAVTAWLGSLVRSRVQWRSARLVDSVGGSLFSTLALLVAAWAIGLAAASSSIPSLSSAARESRVLGTVDDVLPDGSRAVVGQFRDLVGAGAFPSVVLPFEPEPIAGVEPPDGATTRAAGIRTASASVAKVLGEAPGCGRLLEGSGFAVGRDRVMTNAHVVAGTTRVAVITADDRRLPARVVYYDPRTDVAVLSVRRLALPALRFARAPAVPGQPGAVLGYPHNGPFAAEAVRVRSRRTLVGEDVYGRERVRRDVLAVRGEVQPGNSGGPLVDTRGAVLGVVFAASLTDDETGYALTPEEVATALRAGSRRSAPVATGSCRTSS